MFLVKRSRTKNKHKRLNPKHRISQITKLEVDKTVIRQCVVLHFKITLRKSSIEQKEQLVEAKLQKLKHKNMESEAKTGTQPVQNSWGRKQIAISQKLLSLRYFTIYKNALKHTLD